MALFEHLPLEVVTEIFSYLPRRDRVSCTKVCKMWKEVFNTPCLWKNMVIHLDTDLIGIDTSTIFLTKLYHEHFKTMEFCWSNPRIPTRWMQHGLMEFSKRVCHYIMLLQNSPIQLKCVRIVDWFEIPKFKKIIYHLCKFLRSQTNLVNVTFFNANFRKSESVKLLAACLDSAKTIQFLDISNCYHANPSTYESVAFISCMEHFANLLILKIDYTALSSGVLEAIIASNNENLRVLDISIWDYDINGNIISDQAWKSLHVRCPLLRVAIHLKNLCHYENIFPLLKRSILLSTFTLTCGKTWNQRKSRQYRKTLCLIINYYRKTLENIFLHLNCNKEVLDDLILEMTQRCINLKRLSFNGIIESLELLREICRGQTEIKDGFKYFHVSPKILNIQNHCALSKLHNEYAQDLKECNVDFKICNDYTKNVFVYY